MNNESNPQTRAPNQKSERTNTSGQPAENDQQGTVHSKGDGKGPRGQGQTGQSGGRSGADNRTQHADSNGAASQRPGTTERSNSDADADKKGNCLDRADDDQQKKVDPAKGPTAGASNTSKHGSNSTSPGSPRHERGTTNPSQGGRKG